MIGTPHWRALSVVLSAAHELALAGAGVTTMPTPQRMAELARRLLAARDEASLAYDLPRPPVVVQPAPRSVCLRCGAPYEQTETP